MILQVFKEYRSNPNIHFLSTFFFLCIFGGPSAICAQPVYSPTAATDLVKVIRQLQSNEELQREIEISDRQLQQLSELLADSLSVTRDIVLRMQTETLKIQNDKQLSEREKKAKIGEVQRPFAKEIENVSAEVRSEFEEVLLPHQMKRLGQMVTQARYNSGQGVFKMISDLCKNELDVRIDNRLENGLEEVREEYRRKLRELEEETERAIWEKFEKDERKVVREAVGRLIFP